MGMIRLIPAHAGVILCCCWTTAARSSYPRARGGDPSPATDTIKEWGLSPRTRG